MNSRRICTETCDSEGVFGGPPGHGNRVRVPDFPRNREVDERARAETFGPTIATFML